MPYYTTEEPVFYIPEPMNIEWEEEKTNGAGGCSKDDIHPSSTSTIQATSTSMDEVPIPNSSTNSLTNHTNGPPKKAKIQDCIKEFKSLHTQVQDFKKLLKDMKRIKDEIYSMVLHLDFHIDILLETKGEHKDMPKLECIRCKKEFCNCFPKRDGSHLGEVAFPPCKKKKVIYTNF